MSNVLRIKRGLKENLPTLQVGEFAFTTDEKKLYVGSADGNVCINDIKTGTGSGDVVTIQENGKISADILPELESLDASKLTGTIDIARIPHGALERLTVVADDTARFALTNEQVQNGDTVKVASSNIMYFVVDDTKLSTEDGYEVYTAGTATAVAWTGVTGKPTTLSGYGITDAAGKESPALTGTPTAPTPETADNSTKLATTAFVKNQAYLTASSDVDCGTF